MLKKLRGDDGWASVELAIITPALVFLVTVFVSLIGITTQRVNMTATLRDVAIAASHSESIAVLTNIARAELPGFEEILIRIHKALSTPLLDGDWQVVTMTAQHSLPPPFSAMHITWSESMRIPAND